MLGCVSTMGVEIYNGSRLKTVTLERCQSTESSLAVHLMTSPTPQSYLVCPSSPETARSTLKSLLIYSFPTRCLRLISFSLARKSKPQIKVLPALD